MTGPTLFDGRGDDAHIPQCGQFAFQGGEAGGVDAIVVGEEDLHWE